MQISRLRSPFSRSLRNCAENQNMVNRTFWPNKKAKFTYFKRQINSKWKWIANLNENRKNFIGFFFFFAPPIGETLPNNRYIEYFFSVLGAWYSILDASYNVQLKHFSLFFNFFFFFSLFLCSECWGRVSNIFRAILVNVCCCWTCFFFFYSPNF